MPRRFKRKRATVERARELRRTVSKTERRLWFHLSDDKLGAPFRRQHSIGPYFADYCCVPLKLVVEVDGPDHDLERDSVRDALIVAEGFDILRFPVQEVDRNLEGVIATIWEAVQVRLMVQRHVNSSP